MKPLDDFEFNTSHEKNKENNKENVHYKYYKERETLDLFDKTDKKTSLLDKLEFIPIEIASPEKIKEWNYGEVVKPSDVHYCNHHKESELLIDKIFGKRNRK